MSHKSPYMIRNLFECSPSSLKMWTFFNSSSSATKWPEFLATATEKGLNFCNSQVKLSTVWIKVPQFEKSIFLTSTGVSKQTPGKTETSGISSAAEAESRSASEAVFISRLPNEQSFWRNLSTDSVLENDTSNGWVNSQFAQNFRDSKDSENSCNSSIRASLRSFRSLTSPLCSMSSTVWIQLVAFSQSSVALDLWVSNVTSLRFWFNFWSISSSILLSCSRTFVITSSAIDFIFCLISSALLLEVT